LKTNIRYLLLLLITIPSLGFTTDSNAPKSCPIRIQWVDTLQGDFSFTKNWNYPEGVYRNDFGQLDCDGMCPDEIEAMKDSNGKIYPASLKRFYKLLDTTHQFHSIACEAWCYEWAGTDFITSVKSDNNRIICTTQTTAATHCSLILEIINDTCIPRIELTSIAAPGLKIYAGKSGSITIDKTLWKKGIMKAEFNFDFNNTSEPGRKIFWKGKIHTLLVKE
jgi:hypothetical protein